MSPQFENGKLVKPARVTVLHNGVLVHHYQEVYGSTPHATLSSYDDPKVQRSKGPLAFGAHNNPSLGRHSLGTRDLNEALEALRQLDRVKAIEMGHVDPHEIKPNPEAPLGLAEGWSLHMDNVG